MNNSSTKKIQHQILFDDYPDSENVYINGAVTRELLPAFKLLYEDSMIYSIFSNPDIWLQYTTDTTIITSINTSIHTTINTTLNYSLDQITNTLEWLFGTLYLNTNLENMEHRRPEDIATSANIIAKLDNISIFSSTFRGYFTMPIVVVNNGNGHAIGTLIHKKSDDIYDVYLINTGSGTKYHGINNIMTLAHVDEIMKSNTTGGIMRFANVNIDKLKIFMGSMYISTYLRFTDPIDVSMFYSVYVRALVDDVRTDNVRKILNDYSSMTVITPNQTIGNCTTISIVSIIDIITNNVLTAHNITTSYNTDSPMYRFYTTPYSLFYTEVQFEILLNEINYIENEPNFRAIEEYCKSTLGLDFVSFFDRLKEKTEILNRKINSKYINTIENNTTYCEIYPKFRILIAEVYAKIHKLSEKILDMKRRYNDIGQSLIVSSHQPASTGDVFVDDRHIGGIVDDRELITDDRRMYIVYNHVKNKIIKIDEAIEKYNTYTDDNILFETMKIIFGLFGVFNLIDYNIYFNSPDNSTITLFFESIYKLVFIIQKFRIVLTSASVRLNNLIDTIQTNNVYDLLYTHQYFTSIKTYTYDGDDDGYAIEWNMYDVMTGTISGHNVTRVYDKIVGNSLPCFLTLMRFVNNNLDTTIDNNDKHRAIGQKITNMVSLFVQVASNFYVNFKTRHQREKNSDIFPCVFYELNYITAHFMEFTNKITDSIFHTHNFMSIDEFYSGNEQSIRDTNDFHMNKFNEMCVSSKNEIELVNKCAASFRKYFKYFFVCRASDKVQQSLLKSSQNIKNVVYIDMDKTGDTYDFHKNVNTYTSTIFPTPFYLDDTTNNIYLQPLQHSFSGRSTTTNIFSTDGILKIINKYFRSFMTYDITTNKYSFTDIYKTHNFAFVSDSAGGIHKISIKPSLDSYYELHNDVGKIHDMEYILLPMISHDMFYGNFDCPVYDLLKINNDIVFCDSVVSDIDMLFNCTTYNTESTKTDFFNSYWFFNDVNPENPMYSYNVTNLKQYNFGLSTNTLTNRAVCIHYDELVSKMEKHIYHDSGLFESPLQIAGSNSIYIDKLFTSLYKINYKRMATKKSDQVDSISNYRKLLTGRASYNNTVTDYFEICKTLIKFEKFEKLIEKFEEKYIKNIYNKNSLLVNTQFLLNMINILKLDLFDANITQQRKYNLFKNIQRINEQYIESPFVSFLTYTYFIKNNIDFSLNDKQQNEVNNFATYLNLLVHSNSQLNVEKNVHSYYSFISSFITTFCSYSDNFIGDKFIENLCTDHRLVRHNDPKTPTNMFNTYDSYMNIILNDYKLSKTRPIYHKRYSITVDENSISFEPIDYNNDHLLYVHIQNYVFIFNHRHTSFIHNNIILDAESQQTQSYDFSNKYFSTYDVQYDITNTIDTRAQSEVIIIYQKYDNKFRTSYDKSYNIDDIVQLKYLSGISIFDTQAYKLYHVNKTRVYRANDSHKNTYEIIIPNLIQEYDSMGNIIEPNQTLFNEQSDFKPIVKYNSHIVIPLFDILTNNIKSNKSHSAEMHSSIIIDTGILDVLYKVYNKIFAFINMIKKDKLNNLFVYMENYNKYVFVCPEMNEKFVCFINEYDNIDYKYKISLQNNDLILINGNMDHIIKYTFNTNFFVGVSEYMRYYLLYLDNNGSSILNVEIKPNGILNVPEFSSEILIQEFLNKRMYVDAHNILKLQTPKITHTLYGPSNTSKPLAAIYLYDFYASESLYKNYFINLVYNKYNVPIDTMAYDIRLKPDLKRYSFVLDTIEDMPKTDVSRIDNFTLKQTHFDVLNLFGFNMLELKSSYIVPKYLSYLDRNIIYFKALVDMDFVNIQPVPETLKTLININTIYDSTLSADDIIREIRQAKHNPLVGRHFPLTFDMITYYTKLIFMCTRMINDLTEIKRDVSVIVYLLALKQVVFLLDSNLQNYFEYGVKPGQHAANLQFARHNHQIFDLDNMIIDDKININNKIFNFNLNTDDISEHISQRRSSVNIVMPGDIHILNQDINRELHLYIEDTNLNNRQCTILRDDLVQTRTMIVDRLIEFYGIYNQIISEYASYMCFFNLHDFIITNKYMDKYIFSDTLDKIKLNNIQIIIIQIILKIFKLTDTLRIIKEYLSDITQNTFDALPINDRINCEPQYIEQIYDTGAEVGQESKQTDTMICKHALSIIPMFEFIAGYNIRSRQWDVIAQIYNELINQKQVNLHQFLMGEGKSSVVMPLLVLLMKYNKHFNNKKICCVVPQTLVKQTITTINNIVPYFNIEYIANSDYVKSVQLIITSDYNLKLHILDKSSRQYETSHRTAETVGDEVGDIVGDGVMYDKFTDRRRSITYKDARKLTLTRADFETEILKNEIFIYDEVDEIADPLKSQLNMFSNTQKPTRIYKDNDIFNFIHDVIYNIYFNPIIRNKFTENGFNMSPHMIYEHSTYTPDVIDLIDAFYLEQINTRFPTVYDMYIDVYIENNATKDMKLSQDDMYILQFLSSFRKLLLSVFKQKHRRHFGRKYDMLPDNTFKQITANTINDTYAHYFMSVPYTANESPSDNSEYSDHIFKIAITIISYYDNDIDNKIYRIQKLDCYLLAMYLIHIILDIFQDISNPKIKQLICSNYYYTTLAKILKGTKHNYDNLVDNITLNMFDTFSNSEIDIMIINIANNPNIIRLYLVEILFPKIISIYENCLNIAMVDLFDSTQSTMRTGFTGTPLILIDNKVNDSNMDHAIMNIQKRPLDNGNIYASIIGLSERTNNYSLDNLNSIIEHMKGTNKYHVLIDTGSFFVNKTSEDIAIEILRQFKTKSDNTIDAVVFINNKNDKKYVTITSGIIEVNDHSKLSIPLNKVFFYFDQAHITGIDFKIYSNARGMLTISSFNKLRDVAQGLYRMRNINKGQKVDFCMNDALYAECRTTHIINILKNNDDLYLRSQNTEYMKQIFLSQIRIYANNIGMEKFNSILKATGIEYFMWSHNIYIQNISPYIYEARQLKDNVYDSIIDEATLVLRTVDAEDIDDMTLSQLKTILYKLKYSNKISDSTNTILQNEIHSEIQNETQTQTHNQAITTTRSAIDIPKYSLLISTLFNGRFQIADTYLYQKRRKYQTEGQQRTIYPFFKNNTSANAHIFYTPVDLDSENYNFTCMVLFKDKTTRKTNILITNYEVCFFLYDYYMTLGDRDVQYNTEFRIVGIDDILMFDTLRNLNEPVMNYSYFAHYLLNPSLISSADLFRLSYYLNKTDIISMTVQPSQQEIMPFESDFKKFYDSLFNIQIYKIAYHVYHRTIVTSFKIFTKFAQYVSTNLTANISLLQDKQPIYQLLYLYERVENIQNPISKKIRAFIQNDTPLDRNMDNDMVQIQVDLLSLTDNTQYENLLTIIETLEPIHKKYGNIFDSDLIACLYVLFVICSSYIQRSFSIVVFLERYKSIFESVNRFII